MGDCDDIVLHAASEIIGMAEEPGRAVRNKRLIDSPPQVVREWTLLGNGECWKHRGRSSRSPFKDETDQGR